MSTRLKGLVMALAISATLWTVAIEGGRTLYSWNEPVALLTTASLP